MPDPHAHITVEECGCDYTLATVAQGGAITFQLVVDKCPMHRRAQEMLAAGRRLLALMDEAGWADGEESDRVFTQGEVAALRLVHHKIHKERLDALPPAK